MIKMSKNLYLSLFSFIFLFLTYSVSNAQSWDYESYPSLPYNIDHLDAELTLSETGSIEGDLLYLITLKDDNPDSLVLDANRLEILNTVLDDRSAEYYIESDKLIIPIEDEYESGDEISLRIQYRGDPKFGVKQTAKGTYFSSLLPKSTSHWLPVKNHPRVQFTTELIFTHPSGKTLVSNGRRSSSDIDNVSEEITTYTSSKAISPVELTFAFGDIELIGSTRNQGVSGSAASLFERRSDNHIHIYSEGSDVDREKLFETAVSAFEKLYSTLNVGYPFRDLSIVILDDDQWETKSHGAGVVYLYRNRGDLEEQLQRSLTGLWLGSHMRAERWSDANAILAMQARINSELFDLDYITDQTPVPYQVFDGSMESAWRYGFEQESFSTFTRHFDNVRLNMMSETGGVITWRDLAESIYEVSGTPYFEQLDLPEIKIEEEIEYDYVAEMSRNEEDQNISVNFRALGEAVDELVTVQVEEVTFSDQSTDEITFTGSDDTIVINASNETESIQLKITGRDDINLEVKKPFEYWIYQLRNESDSDGRIEAAKALSEYSDDADLQLAIRDHLREEENSEVYAELLRTLSAVTAGASGTDQTFLRHVSTDYSDEVQIAAIDGLAYFSENDQVISRLRSIANQTESDEIRTAAIRSLYETTDSDRFKVISEDLITQESALKQVPMILRLLAEKGEEESAVQFASTFLSEGFPYEIRREILELVLGLDQSQEGWENRLPSLLVDRDPRVRSKSLEALDRTGSGFRDEWLERRRADEYDERVRRVLENL